MYVVNLSNFAMLFCVRHNKVLEQALLLALEHMCKFSMTTRVWG